MKVEILTERCRIRPFRGEDIPDFAAYRNDEEWMRYQGFKNMEEEAYRDILLAEGDLDVGMQLAVADRSTNCLLGDVYLKREGKDMWIGYSIRPESAGQGLAGEAVVGLLRWLASQGYERAFAGVLPENAASIRLLRRLGFEKLEGRDEWGEERYNITLIPDDHK